MYVDSVPEYNIDVLAGFVLHSANLQAYAVSHKYMHTDYVDEPLYNDIALLYVSIASYIIQLTN